VPAQNLIHSAGGSPARRPPLLDLIETKVHYSTQTRGSKVLVDNRIPPVIQQLEILSPCHRGGVRSPQLLPEVHAQATIVRPKAAWLGVAAVQLPTARELGTHEFLQRHGRGNNTDEVIHAFRVQITTEALELRSEKHRVRSVDLLGRVPPPPRRPADGDVGVGDFIQRGRPNRPPMAIRI
jgi:hypothetical protein